MTNTEGHSPQCGYCDSEELAYELESDHGKVVRCIPCLAVEQGQQPLRMPFEEFVSFDPGIVYDSEEQVRESRQNDYEQCRAWWVIMSRIRQDNPILKRDPEDFEAVHEWTREFLINIMGADAHKCPSELVGGVES